MARKRKVEEKKNLEFIMSFCFAGNMLDITDNDIVTSNPT
jgi:hypothetical protein